MMLTKGVIEFKVWESTSEWVGYVLEEQSSDAWKGSGLDVKTQWDVFNAWAGSVTIDREIEGLFAVDSLWYVWGKRESAMIVEAEDWYDLFLPWNGGPGGGDQLLLSWLFFLVCWFVNCLLYGCYGLKLDIDIKIYTRKGERCHLLSHTKKTVVKLWDLRGFRLIAM